MSGSNPAQDEKMSDLSDFVNMDFVTEPPAKPAPATVPLPRISLAPAVPEKAQHPAFRWPTPPFAAYPDAAEQTQAQGCEFVGVSGKAVACRLIFFVPDDRVAHVQVPPARTTMTLRFDQFRSLRVMEPLKPTPVTLGDAKLTSVLEQRPRSSFRIVLKDGNVMEGTTIGHVENAYGLFIFPPVDDKGTVQRLFIPNGGYASHDIGPRIGDVLVSQNSATPQQIEQAAGLQKALRDQKLGDILVERQVVTPEQLLAAIEKQARMPMVRIGEALTSLGMVTDQQLQEALAQQKQDRSVPLGELLVKMGIVSREDLQTALARKMGYPLVNLDAFPFEEDALRKLPFAVAMRVQVMPLMIREGRLVIALDDPVRRRSVVDEVEFITQMKTVPVLAQCARMEDTLAAAYEKIGAATTLRFAAVNPAEAIPFEMQGTDKLVETLEKEDQSALAPEDDRQIEQSDNSLVKLINNMIIEAHQDGVSDIHVESYPGRDKIKIRFRKDGLLRTHLELPPNYRNALIARIKIMCDLDISERRKPQDGKINFAKFSAQHKIELRVATIPTNSGLEDVVMRILASAKPIPLDTLGLSPYNLKNLKDVMERPYGLVLCVGPTGSGKTTTLHSALSHINVPERKIWTAEDPVEITQPGLRQVQVNPKIDWTFAKALRAFLRADPDVIMVGEMRDEETAQMGIEASLTGHLVLSTLHTNSAPETVTRLIDMGLDPFNFADSLLGVLAQRLVRRLCNHCRTSRLATDDEVNELLDDYLHVCPTDHPGFSRDAIRAEWVQRFGRDGKLLSHHSPGCEHCGNTGQRGRAGLHELMIVSRELRRLIQTSARAEELLHTALIGGMRTLRQDGIEKVLQGVTSMAEVRATSNV
jgi:type II secretory ATPase GspE/PulE/Tfp pilus assembly ATPase PilB-like protein